jgi:hypothetical protein
MECQSVREQLSILTHGERLASARLYAGVARHCLGCAACRAVWRRMRREREDARHLPAPPLPPGLKARVMAALPAGATTAGVLPREGRRPRVAPWIVRASLGIGLTVVLMALVPWKGSLSGGAAVEAAVQSANTWHLSGWKIHRGRQIAWEIWGRRTPFFYREQIGEELNFDDGTQRVRIVDTGQDGKLFALRLASGPAPSDQWWSWLAVGVGWRKSKPWRETRDTLIWSGHDSGMQGPYTQADSYLTVDKHTWLPLRYEYHEYEDRNGSRTLAKVTELLRAEYNVALPDSVTTLRLPAGVRLADTLSAPTDPSVPVENAQRAHGVTLQVTPLALDPDGIVLAKVSCWLGNLKLGAEGTSTWNDVETHIRYRTDRETQDTAYHADDGTRYVEFEWPRLDLNLANGDVLKLLAPLEPRPAGAPLPRSLTLNLEVTPQIMTSRGSSVLFGQEFAWTLPLPAKAAPIRIDDYLPPGHRDRMHYAPGADDSTVEGNIARARSHQYEIQNDFDRAIYWTKQELAVVRPSSNTAQFRRLGLAHLYERSHDFRRAAAVYQEVIRVSREHPETWDYYAWQAKGGLKYSRSRRHP